MFGWIRNGHCEDKIYNGVFIHLKLTRKSSCSNSGEYGSVSLNCDTILEDSFHTADLACVVFLIPPTAVKCSISVITVLP